MAEPLQQTAPDGPEIPLPCGPGEPVAPAGAPTPAPPQAAAAAALAALQERENHDAKGRFLPGNTVASKALTKSEALWSALADAKRELIDQLHSDLAINGHAARRGAGGHAGGAAGRASRGRPPRPGERQAGGGGGGGPRLNFARGGGGPPPA